MLTLSFSTFDLKSSAVNPTVDNYFVLTFCVSNMIDCCLRAKIILLPLSTNNVEISSARGRKGL